MAAVLSQLLQVVPQQFVDMPDKYGWSPLHILANVNDEHRIRPGMLRQLVTAKANVDPVKGAGQTPLMGACATGNLDAAKQLFQLGADIYAANSEGTTVYDYAWNNSKVRNWLKDLGVGKGAGVSGTGRLFRGDVFESTQHCGEKSAFLFQKIKARHFIAARSQLFYFIAARSQLFLFPSNPRFPH